MKHSSLGQAKAFFLCLLFSFSGISSFTQEVSISESMNIRNYYAYELIGQVNDRYVVLRDKGYPKEIDVFNQFMERTMSTEILLENKKVSLLSSYSLDTAFSLIYTYPFQDSFVLKQRIYDQKVELLDSFAMVTFPKKHFKKGLLNVLSEDGSLQIFFAPDWENKLRFFLYDVRQKKFLGESTVDIQVDENWYRNIHQYVLSDDGKLFLILQQFDRGPGSKAQTNLISIDTKTLNVSASYLGMENVFMRNVHLDYDNVNGQVIICGLYAIRNSREIEGVYLVKNNASTLGVEVETNFVKFDQELIDYVTRHKKKKNRIFQDFRVKDVVKRNDGGVVLFLELIKEFSRRNSYAAGTDITGGARLRGAWVDYYNEDVIVMSLDQNNIAQWSKVLFKKQFSQDDDAVFSSYFIMKNPSRVRLIYNDQVKTNSTVSEYILDPGGSIARNSLLSTEYQDIKLRFRDALQISNSEILVPSENNYNLNLVKISY